MYVDNDCVKSNNKKSKDNDNTNGNTWATKGNITSLE